MIKYLHAEVVLEEVDAERIVLAGVGVAEADVQLAAVAGPARGARADVAADDVVAGAAVEAGVAGAVVDVLLMLLQIDHLSERRTAAPFAAGRIIRHLNIHFLPRSTPRGSPRGTRTRTCCRGRGSAPSPWGRTGWSRTRRGPPRRSGPRSPAGSRTRSCPQSLQIYEVRTC